MRQPIRGRNKEDVIIGKLIPVGTGMKRYRSIRLNTDETEEVFTEDAETPDFGEEAEGGDTELFGEDAETGSVDGGEEDEFEAADAVGTEEDAFGGADADGVGEIEETEENLEDKDAPEFGDFEESEDLEAEDEDVADGEEARENSGDLVMSGSIE